MSEYSADPTPAPWELMFEEDAKGFPQWRVMYRHSSGAASLLATVHGYRVPLGDGFRETPGGKVNALLISKAPTMFEYIVARAEAGDAAAQKIVEDFNASR